MSVVKKKQAKSTTTVREVMVDNPVTIDASATLLEAAQRMRDANVGMLPVMEGGSLRGLITDRDLVIRAMASDAVPSAVRVGECLTEDVVCARQDWTVDKALVEMARHHIGRLPVVDEQDHIIGVVTLSSLALRASQQEEVLEAAQEVSQRSARAA